MLSGSIPRSVRWRIDLGEKGLVRHDPDQWSAVLEQERRRYLELKKSVLRAPDGSYPEGFGMEKSEESSSQHPTAQHPPVDINNPLSLADDNPWHSHFSKLATLEQIQKDVIRAFPEDEERFKSGSLGGQDRFVSQLSSILFVWSLAEENLSIGYRQGMHEIAGVCWLIVKEDVEKGIQSPSSSKKILLQANDVEAYSFALFQTIMLRAKRWYEWKSVGSSILPIHQHCEMIEESLSSNDVELSRHLKKLSISLSIFAIRWIRLLFLREFPQDIAIELWEALFELDPTLFLVDHICVALIIRIRDSLLSSDNPTALRMLLNYPPGLVSSGDSIRILMDEARQIHRHHTAVLSGIEMPYTHNVSGDWKEGDHTSRNGPTTFGYTAPMLTELTKGISAQSLGAGFNRAITNVQRTVNAAYQAHSAQNASNDGFPPLMNVSSGRRGMVTVDEAPKQQLDKMREVNERMGKTMNEIIDVLQNRWAGEMGSDDKTNKESVGDIREEDQLSMLVSLTALKHIRDVLSGQAIEFDPSVMQLGKKNSNNTNEKRDANAATSSPSYPPRRTSASQRDKDRTFGSRFQRPAEDKTDASSQANLVLSSSYSSQTVSNAESLGNLNSESNSQSPHVVRSIASPSASYDPLGVGG